ncbi:hypothetical protein FVE85_3183 [Porphyridium purpureum]|uniref:Uncharacterized protein n=1 Tax=Porphyridium purpureum TaxID=35688 RepID=A0A5J4YVR0_PORPP|nr:hypothetical protein FVE85_3183 [Porphyridium purpureum]|eukprot:POR6950..scf227_4
MNETMTMPAVEADCPRLVLHFDLNETILVTDPAGGDGLEDCLNKALAKQVFVRRESDPSGPPIWENPESGPEINTSWVWPDGCVLFYDVYRAHAKTFTEPGNYGASLRGLYLEMLDALRIPEGETIDPRLSQDGKHYFVLPAFFHTLRELRKRSGHTRIVLRTFGHDLSDVCAAINAFAETEPSPAGAPASASGWHEMKCDESHMWDGRYDRQSGQFVLSQPSTGRACKSEEEAVAVIEGRHVPHAEGMSIMAISDDYEWWRGNGFAPECGKPLWLTLTRGHAVHIFFDDNIHNKARNSIVAVRLRTSPENPFCALPGALVLEKQLHGKCMWRCPTVRPILDHNWFLQKIEAALERCRTEDDAI